LNPSEWMNTRAVENVFAHAGLAPKKASVRAITLYLQELLEWNARMDLTGLKGLESMAIKHVGDTLTILPWIKEDKLKLLDIGTGAGIPGIILKILRPRARVVLVDARRKRVSFLRFVISRLNLKGVEAIKARLPLKQEDIKRYPSLGPGTFDIAISRAVGDVVTMGRLSRPFLKKEGRFIIMKGPKALLELEKARETLEMEGWKVWHVESRLPVTGDRRVIVFGMADRA